MVGYKWCFSAGIIERMGDKIYFGNKTDFPVKQSYGVCLVYVQPLMIV